MRLGELASVQRWLPTHPLATDSLWQRDTHAISNGEILLFYARASTQGFRRDAIEAIDTVQAAVIKAVFDGELAEPPAALVMHEPPLEPYFVDELVDSLAKLRPARRQAALFALETAKLPSNVAEMTWVTASKLQQMTPLCQEILTAAGKTRHLKLPYVFWEWATPQIATPLLELQWSIEQAFDCKWPALVGLYRRMVMVHRSADSASLLGLANH